MREYEYAGKRAQRNFNIRSIVPSPETVFMSLLYFPLLLLLLLVVVVVVVPPPHVFMA
jgi:hypothetical protein